ENDDSVGSRNGSSFLRYNRRASKAVQEVRMPVETPSIFSKIIEEHLELKRRNSELERELPLSRYVNDDPFHNHPLFKTEEQARLEETMDGAEPAVTVAVAAAIEPEAAL